MLALLVGEDLRCIISGTSGYLSRAIDDIQLIKNICMYIMSSVSHAHNVDK